ncbi:MAG: hypothetical protein KatS3mg110_2865 [Pirellulaceae bacterium]|nr:MAG: hypothetical protein KatS3mg110_2865 [Pirellulaceae bacterium]
MVSSGRMSGWLVGWLAVVATAVTSFAQPPTTGAPPPTVERVVPDVYHLRDASGNLIPVPDLSLEEYQRWLQRQSQGVLPPYAISSVTVWGWLRGERAELEVRIELRVDRAVREPIAIPLRLFPALLHEHRYEGPGHAAIGLDRSSSSYVWWVQTSSGSRHTLVARLVAPVRQDAQRRQFELSLPDALTHIELLVDEAPVQYGVSGEQFLTKQPIRVGATHSKLEMDGYGGNVAVWLRAAPDGAAAIKPYLSVTTQATLVIQDPTRYRVDLLYDIRTESGSWEVFHVRLPAGARLLPPEAVGYQLQFLEEASDGLGPSVRVIRTAQQDRPITVRFSIEVRPSAAGAPFEAALFSVPEAYFQRVDVTVRVEGDWAVRVVQARQVRRLAAPSPAERQQGLMGRYVYFPSPMHPPSLQLLVHPQQSLLSIEPHYLLRIAGSRLWLDLYLRCRVRGAPAKGFDLATAGWKVHSILPEDWIESQPAPPQANPQTLPVLLATDRLPGEGNFDLHLVAETMIDVTSREPVALPLPIPRNSTEYTDQLVTVLPAVVVLEAGPDMEVTPVPALMPDLVSAPPSVAEWLVAQLPQLPNRNRHVFQRLGAEEPLQVAFVARPLPQALDVSVITTLHPDPQALRVVQQWSLDIAHQPLSLLEFTTTEKGVAPRPIEFWVDDERVESVEESHESGLRRWRLHLPSPWLGRHTVRISYSVPEPPGPPAGAPSLVVPLLTLGTNLPVITMRSEIRLPEPSSDFPYRVQIPKGSWTVDHASAQCSCQLTESVPEIVLERQPFGGAGDAVEVERAWIQTVFTGQQRIDRCAFRFRISGGQVRVRLPEDVPLRRDDVTVALNGKLWPRWGWESPRLLEVDCHDQPADSVLELWYRSDSSLAVWDSLPVEFPRIENAAGLYLLYWELILPARYHLIADPKGFTAQYQWRWQGGWFSRQSSRSVRQMEDWVGAAHGPGLPQELNRYVFAAVGRPAPAHVTVASRGWLVLAASLFVLAVGWVWQQWPALRRGVLVLAAVGLVVVGLGRIEWGLLVGQAGLVGLAALLVARLIQTGWGRPMRPARTARVSTVIRSEPLVPATAATVSAPTSPRESPSGAAHA